MFDLLLERAPRSTKIERPPIQEAPRVEEEPRKRFNYEFDEPVHPTEAVAPVPPRTDEVPPAGSRSLLTMRREGKRLSNKQKALLQAAAISRTPLPKIEERPLSETKEKEEGQSNHGTEIDEEKKKIHSRVWELVRSKWF